MTLTTLSLAPARVPDTAYGAVRAMCRGVIAYTEGRDITDEDKAEIATAYGAPAWDDIDPLVQVELVAWFGTGINKAEKL